MTEPSHHDSSAPITLGQFEGISSPSVVERGSSELDLQINSAEDVMLATGRSRTHSRRRSTPVSPTYSEDDLKHDRAVALSHSAAVADSASQPVDVSDQPALTAFISSMQHGARPGSFRRGQHPLTELVWRNLTISSKANRQGKGKVLLDHVDGKLSYGLTALMGPSGSGKTTLLNSLACRLDVSTQQSGDIWLNGETYSNAELKRIAGYVMQDDLLNAHLTVHETLTYAAHLRLPSNWTEEQKSQRVDEVIYDMGLEGCRHVLIGNHELKGISGGQKRRVCVCVQLLTRPQLLFLDEPTSGLDSVTAYELVMTLHSLSQNTGCTVVASIHQPQAKIFNLFTHVILLRDGRVLYQGRRSEVLATFAEAGFPCPTYTNPADHIMDVITNTNSTTAEQAAAVESSLLAASKGNPGLLSTQSSAPKVFATVVSATEYAEHRLGWGPQTAILFRRNMQEQWRKKSIMLTSLIQSLIMAILIGTAFLSIGTSQSAVSKRQSVLFFCVVNQGIFGALMVINSFPSERSLTLRERASGTYFVSAYFMAKIAAETITQLPIPILFSFTVYWLIGLANTAGQFVIFMIFMILCSLAATSLALMVSALSRTIDLSVTILPLVLEISRLFGGFFLSPAQLPKYFSWLDALSYIKYTYVGISLNELRGMTYQCSNPPGTQVCSGGQEIGILGLDYISIGGCVGALIGYIVFARLIAFGAVRQLKA